MLQPTVESPSTACDGLLTGLGRPNFEVLRRQAVEIGTADEASIATAAVDLCRHLRVVVEPSAAVTLAVLRQMRTELAGRRIAVILTGGNTDFSFLCAAVRETLAHCPGR